MAAKKGRGRATNQRRGGTPRAARASETVREVVAEELLRIDDDRLAFVTITAIDVDTEMQRGIVYFDSLQGAEGDAGIVEALESHRKQLQAAIARQVHSRRTPVLQFRPDASVRAAERIDEVLRADGWRERIAERDDADGA